MRDVHGLTGGIYAAHLQAKKAGLDTKATTSDTGNSDGQVVTNEVSFRI